MASEVFVDTLSFIDLTGTFSRSNEERGVGKDIVCVCVCGLNDVRKIELSTFTKKKNDTLSVYAYS